MVLLPGNLYISKVQEVVKHYPGGGGGGPTFPGGREVVQLFPGWNPFVNLYRNPHNL